MLKRAAAAGRNGGRSGVNPRGGLAGGVEDRRSDTRDDDGVGFIFEFGGDVDRGRGGAGSDVGCDVRSPVRDVERVSFHQPDMAINSRALVEPAFVFGGINADDDDVRAAVVDEVRDVVAEGRVAGHVAAEIEAVDGDDGIAEDAVEFEGEAAAEIGGGNFEDAAVPADACLRVGAAERARAVGEEIFDVFLNGQLD